MRNIVLHIHIFFAVALIALVFAGCRDRHAAELLARADAVMETAPDSARVLLDSIEPSGLGAADVALYAVLDAQSRHKLDLPAPSDSLLTLAVDHYIAHGPDSLLMKALFYRAVGYQQRGDIKQAAADATGSWEVADESENHYWIAKSAELVADLANDISNYKEELHWRQLAALHYGLAGKLYNHITAICDMSSTHLNLHHDARALALDDSIRRILMELPEDMELQLYHANTSLFIQNQYGSISDADSLYQFLINNDEIVKDDPHISLVKANILLHEGHLEECHALLDSLGSNLHSIQERSMLHAIYYDMAKKSGNSTFLEKMTDSLLHDQNILISLALEQPVTTSQRDYFHIQAHSYKDGRQKAETNGRRILVLAFVVVVTGSICHIIRIRRNKRKLEEKIQQIMTVTGELENEINERKGIEAELEGMRKLHAEMAEELTLITKLRIEDGDLINSLNDKLKVQQKHVCKLTKKLDATSMRLKYVYTEKWSTINLLCTQFKACDGKNASIVMANIFKELDNMKSNEFYRTLESDINMNMGGLMSKFRTRCDGWREDLVRIAMLFFAGFSPTAVALLTDLTPRTIYNRKKAIIQKITLLDSLDKDLFLSLLKN